MHPALLLLTDSRLPAGGHAHSGGTEQAIASGAVHDVPTLAAFLKGRLHTAGAVTAALTAAACAHAASTTTAPITGTPGTPLWGRLDAEVDARTASPAQRHASRTQGRLLLRVARRVWPSPVLDGLAAESPNPHHPIALGTAAHAAGATPEEAAMAAAYHAISGPATAAVRLLGLDPVAVHGLLATLAPDLTAVTAGACRAAVHQDPGWAALPACSAPALDLLAERHATAEVRLFVS
ncbi:urease accessory protein UreF [Nonomuraea jiangxiensis]|uniref:Urease accessory protein UreF n=1 Tax=Nonomuraea jiangxiensis TaxID=633440 RepID=A0A1G7YKS6_9ACTN|nr:urease accessory UreF family protein [Nonomuraea jiangxiensis]SDG96440.1 urease accessory protein [Nonomuraea jiangxiensis]